MTKRGIIHEGTDRAKRIPGQMTEMTFGSVATLPMQMSMPPQTQSPRSTEKVVDLFLEVDMSNPQFMAINGKVGEIKLPVGRIHNTNLGNKEGLRHTFSEVKSSVRRSLGLSESDDVSFGDFTWRRNLIPYTIEKMISEALTYNDIALTGVFGPNTSGDYRTVLKKTGWFTQPSMHEHAPVTLEEAVNIGKLPPQVKKKITGIMAMYSKNRSKSKALKALTKALTGHVGDPEAAAKYMVKTMSLTGNEGSGMAMESTELECPECTGRFLVTEDLLNEDEGGTFVICPHCKYEAAIDEGTVQTIRKTTADVVQALAKRQPSEIKRMAKNVSSLRSGMKKAFGKSDIGKAASGMKLGEDLDEAMAFTTLGTDKALKGYKKFQIGHGKITTVRAGLRKGVIPFARMSTQKSPKFLQLPKSMKNKQKVSAAYAVGKHQGEQEATRKMTVTGIAMALGTLLGIAGFKKLLGTSIYAKIKKATAEFVNAKVKGHGVDTEKQVTHAINTVTELPRVRWKLRNIAHTLQSVPPAQQQKAIEKAAMEIGLIVLKEIGM